MDAYTVRPGQSIFIEDMFSKPEASRSAVANSIDEVPAPIDVKRQMQKQFNLAVTTQPNLKVFPEISTQMLEELFRRFLAQN